MWRHVRTCAAKHRGAALIHSVCVCMDMYANMCIDMNIGMGIGMDIGMGIGMDTGIGIGMGTSMDIGNRHGHRH